MGHDRNHAAGLASGARREMLPRRTRRSGSCLHVWRARSAADRLRKPEVEVAPAVDAANGRWVQLEVQSGEWRYRLGVRTRGSQPRDRGSNPRTATIIIEEPSSSLCHRPRAIARGRFCIGADRAGNAGRVDGARVLPSGCRELRVRQAGDGGVLKAHARQIRYGDLRHARPTGLAARDDLSQLAVHLVFAQEAC